VRRAPGDTYFGLDGGGGGGRRVDGSGDDGGGGDAPLVPSAAQRAARSALGLDPTTPTVLVVGGGDGVGGLAAIVPALTAALSSRGRGGGGAPPAHPTAQVVVIAGKNEAVRRRIAATPPVPGVAVVAKGFVSNMAEWMTAADCLVTKAGPGTIAEALICGLPMVLSAYLPGQEAPNVPYVVDAGVGVYHRRPAEIAGVVADWLARPGRLRRMSARARALGRADATREIARSIGAMIL